MIIRGKHAGCTGLNAGRQACQTLSWAAHRLHGLAVRRPWAVVGLWALGAALGLVVLAFQDAALTDLCVSR